MMGNQRICSTFIPMKILEHYDTMAKTKPNVIWSSLSEKSIWNELCFCILSANVNYDLAKSTISYLHQKQFLDPVWILSKRNSVAILKNELSKPVFLPKKKDGTLRKYRYPEKRAFQIVKNARFVYKTNGSLKNILTAYDDPVETRNYLIENIHGIGIKEASHFLRNIGYCDSLAIIDVHVLAFLEKLSLVQFASTSHLNTKLYIKLEKILQNFAKYHNKILSILDIAIWHYMRNSIV